MTLDTLRSALRSLLETSRSKKKKSWPAADQPLLPAAATAGMLKVAEAVLKQGAAVNAVATNGCTALMNAVANSHAAVAGLLCRAGAHMHDWRIESKLATSALDAATTLEDLPMVKQLLACGADINAVYEQPLVLQAISQYDILAALLSGGAVLSPALQNRCLTAVSSRLDDAAAARITTLLLPHCSSFDVTDASSKSTALMQAIIHGKLPVARVLRAAGTDLQRRDDTGTAMHYAAVSGSVAVVKWLQSLGFNPREPSSSGMLPLHIACKYKHAKLVQYLLDVPGGSSDVHAQCPNGQTALHTAVHSGNSSIVQQLLQRGADVRALFAHGSSVLMLATTAPVTKLLLAAGAAVDCADSLSMTALHHCAMGGTAAGVVCMMIQAGADPTALAHNGSTPAHVAGMRGHFALEALLSRAAEDYRRKHPQAAVVATSVRGAAAEHTGAADSDSNVSSSASSSSATAADNSGRDRTAAASIDSSITTSSSIASGTDAATVATVATRKECQECIAPASAVDACDKQTSTSTATAAADDVRQNTAVSALEPTASSNTSSSISTTSNTAHASSHTVAAQQADAAVVGISKLLGAVTVQQQPSTKARKAKQPCANCKQPTGRLCRRCAAVYYCSVECQRVCFSDAQHRAQCEATAAAQVS
jgi:ankyrin repeat protein